MTTITYSSNSRFRSLYTGMLRRNLGTGIYLTLAMVFFFPLQYLLELMRQAKLAAEPFQPVHYYSDLCGPANNYTSLALASMGMILLAAPVVLSVVQNNYMHSRRAVDLFHSLPVTRRQLMCASAATVFTLVGAPLVLCHLLVLAIGGGYTASGAIPGLEFLPGAMLMDLLGWLVTIAAIIAVMMLVGALVGSPFENFVLGCELLAAGPILKEINSLLFHAYLVGYAGSVSARDLSFLTPAALMLARYVDCNIGEPTGFYDVLILLWMGAAAVIFLLALWLYSRRKSEVAETTGARGVLGAAIKIIAVYIGGAAIGGIFTAVNGNTDFTFVVGVFLGACLTIFLVEAVLGRGFKGMKKALPGMGALVAGATALAIILVTGGLGYETRIPAQASIQSADLGFRGRYGYVSEYEAGYRGQWDNTDERSNREYPYYYSYRTVSSVTLSSPEALELVRQYHQALINCNVLGTGEDNNYYGFGYLEYQLKRGTFERDYNRMGAEGAGILLELEKTQEFRESANPVLRLESGDLESYQAVDRCGVAGSGKQTDQGKIGELLSALQADMREEDYDRFNSGEARVLGLLYLDTGFRDKGYAPLEKNTFESFSVPILDSYRRTAAILEAQGLGQYLEEPDLGQISALGIQEYNFGYGMREDSFYQIPAWQPQGEWGKGEFPYLAEEEEAIRAILSKCRLYSVGRKEEPMLYVTVLSGDNVGVTLGLSWDDAPEEIRESFPYIMEKYEYDGIAAPEWAMTAIF